MTNSPNTSPHGEDRYVSKNDDLQVILRRAQISQHRGKIGVDITVKLSNGNARLFAPTWDMVLDHKQGRITWDEYVDRYTRKLKTLGRSCWEWLRDQVDEGGEVVLLCFCRDETDEAKGRKCHTHLVIDYGCRNFPEMFRDGRESTCADRPILVNSKSKGTEIE